MRGRARLNPDEAGGQSSEIVEHLSSPQANLRNHATVCVGRMDLEDVLGNVYTDDTNLHGDGSCLK
jgi:hypothetical protein